MELLSHRLCIYSHLIDCQTISKSGFDQFTLSLAEHKNSRSSETLGTNYLGHLELFPSTWDVFIVFLISTKMVLVLL